MNGRVAALWAVWIVALATALVAGSWRGPITDGIGPDADVAQGGGRIVLPLVLRRAAPGDIPPPPTAAPTAADTAAPTWTPTSTATATGAATATMTATASVTATVTVTATATVTATVTPGPTAQPGVPDCARTDGDAGGFRFSKDGGATLAPNARRLANIAYTWDIEVHPIDPDDILELHQGRLYRSLDAGCTFREMSGVPQGDWDRLVRSPSHPRILVLATINAHSIAWSQDGGDHWTTEAVPDDVVELAIDPVDPWRWTMAGRGPSLYTRAAAGDRWTGLAVPLEGSEGIISAGYAPTRTERWLVGSSTRGLYLTDDGGLTWTRTAREMFEPHGDPPQETIAVVPASITFAPSDPGVAYAVVNQVSRTTGSLRGIWRTGDGGRTWERRVADEDPVGDRRAQLTGGTRVFVSPLDPDWTFFAFGIAYSGYGTDLFRSRDGLATLEVSHFDDFYKVYAMGFGPPVTNVVFVGASSDVPPPGAD